MINSSFYSKGSNLPGFTDSLKLLSLNVEGLESLLDDPIFTSLAFAHICLLTETMRKEDTNSILMAFGIFHRLGQSKRKGSHSGGITILVKT